MGPSTYRWLIVENANMFQIYAKYSRIFPRGRNCRILIGLSKQVFMNHGIMFLNKDNKKNLLPDFFFFFFFQNFYERKISFTLQSVIVITIVTLCIIKKQSKLIYLHCFCKRIVEKSN